MYIHLHLCLQFLTNRQNANKKNAPYSGIVLFAVYRIWSSHFNSVKIYSLTFLTKQLYSALLLVDPIIK